MSIRPSLLVVFSIFERSLGLSAQNAKVERERWTQAENTRMNVFMIVVDDLRPEIAAPGYDKSYMITPNIDKLASRGTVFTRAYCQQAICGPTRNSFLSGRRPQRTKAWNLRDHFRDPLVGGQHWVTFPGYFKNAGYNTYGSGKTYHFHLPPHSDGNQSWSDDRPYVLRGDGAWVRPLGTPGNVHSEVRPDDEPMTNLRHYVDGANLEPMLEHISHAHNKTGPFFLMYGPQKPHIPFHMPKQVWDMYPPEQDIELAKHKKAPDGIPPMAFTYEMDGKTTIDVCVSYENCGSHPIPYPNNNTLPDYAAQAMRKGYYASVTWVDHLIGQALDQLEALGHKDDTIVALVGDHGWQLGEHNIWGKHTNFELATRVPLIISDPRQKGGKVSDAIVESVDLYPTIAKLAGLQLPPDVDGMDQSGLITGEVEEGSTIKKAAFSEYPRCPQNIAEPWNDTDSCVDTHRSEFTAIGYTVRTEEWRYTIWLHWDGKRLVGDFNRPKIGEELYMHKLEKRGDFDSHENENLAVLKARQYSRVINHHYGLARKHWDKPSSLAVDPASIKPLIWPPPNHGEEVKEKKKGSCKDKKGDDKHDKKDDDKHDKKDKKDDDKHKKKLSRHDADKDDCHDKDDDKHEKKKTTDEKHKKKLSRKSDPITQHMIAAADSMTAKVEKMSHRFHRQQDDIDSVTAPEDDQSWSAWWSSLSTWQCMQLVTLQLVLLLVVIRLVCFVKPEQQSH